MTPLKMAVIGVGALGRHHARILADMPGVDLVAVADPNEKQGRAVAAEHGTTWLADFHDLPDEVRAVSIAVPTRHHLEVAATFLNRHVPVMIEKPIAADVTEAERLVRLAERRETLLQVGHVERFNPATRVARELVGAAKYVRSNRVSPYTFRSTDIGVTHDLMIHDVDLLLDLVGSAALVRVEAMGLSVFGEHEDVAQARLQFDNGCIADLTASRLSPTVERNMQIWSTTGVVDLDFGARTVKRYSPSVQLAHGPSPLQLAARGTANVADLKERVFGEFIEIEQPEIPEADALTEELAEFTHCVRTGTAPTIDGERALAAMRVVDAIQRAIARHPWTGNVLGPRGPFVPLDQPVRHAA